MRLRPARLLAAFALALALARPLSAQTNTAEMLQRAIHLYEQVEIERALVLLRQIISPASPFEVSREQRVVAYKYLGAALALEQGPEKRDSAVVYFRAAIERDPFVDLDPRTFSPAQVSALAEARNRTFAVALAPLLPDTIQPGAGRLACRSLTTHAGTLRVEIRSGGVTRRVLFDGPNEGVRDLAWDGTLTDGSLPPPGRYQLVAAGHSTLLDISDSTSAAFDVALDHPPLADTLPDLGPGDLLPEQRPASAATTDLLTGVGVAALALLIPRTVSASDVGAGKAGLSNVVAGAGALSGVLAFVVGRSHREIPENVAENQRRRDERRAANAATARRNAGILAGAGVIVTPVAAAAP